MNKISIALFSIIAMAGVASAQTAKGSASAGATVNAGGTAKAGAGAATGAAGSATGAAKAGAGAATGAAGNAAGQAKAGAGGAAGAAGGATAQAGAAMEMPKPPAEIKDLVKMAGARNTCKGTGLGMDMKSEVKFTGTITRKADLDNWWVHESMTGTMGEGKAKMTMKMEAYMTWDAKMGKWRMVSVMNDGTQMVGTADFKDGKLEAVSDTVGPMGSGMFKDHGDATDKKVGMHMWGEMSMDKGKTWTKVYDMTCK